MGTNTAISNVTVFATPTVVVNSGAICSGRSFTINPTGANSYSYSSGSAVVSPIASAAYTVIGTSAQGCASSGAISNVTVYVSPTISVNSGAICSGQSFTIVPSGAASYTISGGSPIVSPANTSSYLINGVSAQGCVSANTAICNVTVNSTPTISVNSGSVCSGKSFTIIPSGAFSYTYSSGSPIVSPTANANYNVSGTSAQGCVGSNTAICNVFVNPSPIVSAISSNASICAGETATIIANGAFSYLWSNASTSATITVFPTVTTAYTVTGTATNGCSNTSIITQTVSLCTGIEKQNKTENLLIYPNPNNGAFTLVSEADLDLAIINEMGQLVKSVSLNEGNEHRLSISEMSNGIYFIIGKGDTTTIKQKVSVNK